MSHPRFYATPYPCYDVETGREWNEGYAVVDTWTLGTVARVESGRTAERIAQLLNRGLRGHRLEIARRLAGQ